MNPLIILGAVGAAALLLAKKSGASAGASAGAPVTPQSVGLGTSFVGPKKQTIVKNNRTYTAWVWSNGLTAFVVAQDQSGDYVAFKQDPGKTATLIAMSPVGGDKNNTLMSDWSLPL